MEPAKAQEHKIEECPREEELERLNLQARYIEYNDYTELVKSLDITNFAPPEWLQHTETPFKWSQCLKPELLHKANLDSKLDDYSYNNSCYILEKCSLLLTLVFEKVLLKNNAKARIHLKQLKEELSNISCDESNEIFTRVGPALNHIYSATNAYLMSTTTDLQLEETSKKIGASLEPVDKMSPQIQAGVQALKGRFYLWCYLDSNYPLQHMRKASVLDPDFGPWQYWIGKILRKIRRKMREKEPKEEIPYLESAVEKQRDPKHLIYLAQAYREKASFLHKANSSDFGFFKSDISREINTLNQKSLDLYRECWSKAQDTPALFRRLGNGLMNFPRYQAAYGLAKEALHKAEELSKDAVTYHILGKFYIRYEQDEEKAREYYQKAADCGLVYGHNELIRLNFLNDPNYDPYEDLKKQEEATKYFSNVDGVICDIGWYYLFFKNDLPKALEYFWKIIEKDEECVNLKKFNSYSFFVKDHVNIYSVLKNEIKKMEGKEVPEIISKFLEKISKNSSLVDDTDDKDVASIKKEVELDLRANRRRQNLNSPEIMRSDSLVGIRFPGKNYYEYRAKTLQELTELLRSQQQQSRSIESEPRIAMIENSKNLQENWRSDNRNFTTSITAGVGNINKIRDHNKNQNSPTMNWRTELKTVTPTENENKNKDKHVNPQQYD